LSFVFVRLSRVVVDDVLDGVFLVLDGRVRGFCFSDLLDRTPDCERVMAMCSDLAYTVTLRGQNLDCKSSTALSWTASSQQTAVAVKCRSCRVSCRTSSIAQLSIVHSFLKFQGRSMTSSMHGET